MTGICGAECSGCGVRGSSTIRAAIDLALEAKKKNEKKTIVFNLSGHGLLDMSGYASYLGGKMENSC